MIKKAVIILVFFVLGLQLQAQQTYTDEEIGFDRAYFEKLYLEEGLSTEKIKIFLNETRELYVKKASKQEIVKQKGPILNSSKQTMDTDIQIRGGACVNMGFEDNNFNGWCRRIGLFNGYSQAGYNVEYSALECNENIAIVENLPPYDNPKEDCFGINRFQIVNNTSSDLHGIQLDEIEGDFAVKLGNECVSKRVDRIERTINVTLTNSIFDYRYALVLEDTGTCSHIQFENIDPNDCDPNNPPPPGTTITSHGKPYFTVYLEDDEGRKIDCSEFLVFGDNRIFNFDTSNTDPGVFVKHWQNNSLNLLDYVNLNDTVSIVAEVADCAAGAHFGYAYFEAACGNEINEVEITASPLPSCTNESITFSSSQIVEDYIWTFYDLNGVDILDVSFENTPSFTYSDPGFYLVTYALPNTGTTSNCSENEASILVEIEDCGMGSDDCDDCYSFKPIPKEHYVLSAWTKVDLQNQVKHYENTSIKIKYLDADNDEINNDVFWTSGRIIEGWQRIYEEFEIPENTVSIAIVLQNRSTMPTYFDDIRIHPFNGNMKSFAYDPETQRLMAELDENNYSTYYEYDSEGGLIRVKKETEKGIYTIQETRSKSAIKN